MDTIKIVLLFNEDDVRQRTVGEFLKTQKRCKTAFITELVYDWMNQRDGKKKSEVFAGEQELLEKVKTALLSDISFVTQLSSLMADTKESLPGKHEQKNPETKVEMDAAGNSDISLDMDEDMMLAGLSMFESQEDF
ncbi:MAG: hypothetical protein LUI14_00865 [Lachnospiraceae bacterium]|nr:hypothetical protein [Lachnospiraceae bacterium]